MIKFIDKTEFIRYSRERCINKVLSVRRTVPKDELKIFREGVVRMKM